MSCSSAEALFEPFLDGELSAGERRSVLGHVDGCAPCRGLFDELRAVDALLIEPRRVELASNFTSATMAQAESLAPPSAYRPPVRAYVVSYLAGAWLVAAAAVVFEPEPVHAAAGVLLAAARAVGDSAGGLGTVISRSLGHSGTAVGAMVGSLAALDIALIVAFGAALKFMRFPAREQLRS